ncbi:Os10g0143800, partial [Oryza sativa Japonica Group]
CTNKSMAQTATRSIAAQKTNLNNGRRDITNNEAHLVVPRVQILEGILFSVEELTKSRVFANPFLKRLH